MDYYHKIPDSELREQFAAQKATQDLENLVTNSFSNNQSIAFETNFNTVPKTWIQQATDLGYRITIFFFTLDTIEKAKERVLIRAKNNGHYVSDETITY